MEQNEKNPIVQAVEAEVSSIKKSYVSGSLQKIAAYLIVAVVCLVVLNFVIKSLVVNETEAKLKTVDAKVESVSEQVKKSLDTLKKENEFFADRMYSIESKELQFRNRLDMNSRAITKLSLEQIKLKKIYNEKIRVVDGYSNAQLDSFFSSRYSRIKK